MSNRAKTILMKHLRPFFFGILLILFFSVVVNARNLPAVDCNLGEVKADVRPSPVDQPTEVSVGLRLIDVTGIQDISQTITADFMVTQEWTDHRMVGFEGCQFKLNDIWTPQIDIINFGRLFPHLSKSVEVLEGGRLRQAQRYTGSLVFVYDAHRFPFDTQKIVLSLLSEEYDDGDVKIAIDDSVTGRSPNTFNIPDWVISGVDAKVVPQYFEILNSNHSAFEFYITAKRRSGYFIWKVIMPLMLIVFMSWTVFWIKPSQVGPQISMSATSMLTLIAFQFAMSAILPRLSYFTIMDRFIAGSTILVFMALIESITTNYLTTIGRESLALRLDRHCSWLFPAVFFVFALIVFSG
jgi:hypothetical protein